MPAYFHFFQRDVLYVAFAHSLLEDVKHERFCAHPGSRTAWFDHLQGMNILALCAFGCHREHDRSLLPICQAPCCYAMRLQAAADEQDAFEL
jgi:hypothetical protein